MAPVTINEFYAIFFGTKSNIFETLYSVLIRYCINNQFLVPMMIMTYVKYATIVSLKSITTIDADDVQHHHGRRKSSKWIKRQLDNERIKRMEIKQLAVMNRYFSRMLSPLLLLYVITYNLDMITFFFWQLKRSRFFFTFLTLTSFWNYFAYIVFLDNRIEKLLEKIIKNVYIVVVGWLVGWFVVEMKKKRDPVYPSQSNVFITTTTTTITKYDVEKGSITF